MFSFLADPQFDVELVFIKTTCEEKFSVGLTSKEKSHII